MDRRLLFPAIAATALAQQTSPARIEAEKALRARAEQFYQLEVDKKFRQAEDFVAVDTKDYYYDNGKPDLRAVKIDRIEFTDDTHAIVHLIATVVMTAAGIGAQKFDVPAPANWKLEDGLWRMHVDQSAEIDTPFGKWRPGTSGDKGPSLPPGMMDPTKIESAVTVDHSTIDLATGSDSVIIINHLPGAISLELSADRPKGLVVKIDKTKLEAGEKATVSFSKDGDSQPAGAVHIVAMPINQELVVQIKAQKP
jgi:hypothetical protein